MERRPDIGLDSYDRLFPNQDTMPQGGFGNLIALPLQKGPRKQDNSVFLDDHLIPWLRGVNYYCRLATTISAGEGAAKERRPPPDGARLLSSAG